MQVIGNVQIPNTTNNTNFKAIKSVRYEGLYNNKDFKKYRQGLESAFKNNTTVKNFCKIHDVDVIFYAYKKAHDLVESSVSVIFKNYTKKKFLGFIGSNKDRIHTASHGEGYILSEALDKSSEELKKSFANKGSLTEAILEKEKSIRQAFIKNMF